MGKGEIGYLCPGQIDRQIDNGQIDRQIDNGQIDRLWKDIVVGNNRQIDSKYQLNS